MKKDGRERKGRGILEVGEVGNKNRSRIWGKAAIVLLSLLRQDLNRAPD